MSWFRRKPKAPPPRRRLSDLIREQWEAGGELVVDPRTLRSYRGPVPLHNYPPKRTVWNSR